MSTCLYSFIDSLGPKDQHLICYSDRCPGENKARATTLALFHALHNGNSSLEIRDHKFLVPGHSDMEVDSMHSNCDSVSMVADL